MSRSPTQDDSSRLLDEQVIDLDLESSEGQVEDDTSLQSEENVCVKCLFSDETFLSAAAMLEHAKSTHRFDLLSVVEALSLDYYDTMKLINYTRAETAQGNLHPDVSSRALFQDDRFLLPVLPDDALLYSIIDLLPPEKVSQSRAHGQVDSMQSKSECEMEREIKDLKVCFEEYRQATQKLLNRRLELNQDEAGEDLAISKSGNEASDKGYFDSYAYSGIHETMLKDKIRTEAYRDFIYDHKHLFKDKVVLDVGCGTGVLSMFCARAGAKKVIAVENSGIIDNARKIIRLNGLEKQITIIHGRIEDVTLPVSEVDIIVSEWMGYCLFFEAMLDSVIKARSKYLKKPDGLMVPSHCSIRLAPIADPDLRSEKLGFWHDVYGFDMSPLEGEVCEDVLSLHLAVESLAASPCTVLWVPTHSIEVSGVDFTAPFQFELDRDVEALDGWSLWFDTFFLPRPTSQLPPHCTAESWNGSGLEGGVAFTTGPMGPETHWRSGVMLIRRGSATAAALPKGSIINGSIAYTKSKDDRRALDIVVQWAVEGSTEKGLQLWHVR